MSLERGYKPNPEKAIPKGYDKIPTSSVVGGDTVTNASLKSKRQMKREHMRRMRIRSKRIRDMELKDISSNNDNSIL